MQEIEQAIERLPGIAFAVDDDLRVVAWNRKAEEGLGMSAGKAIGLLCYEAVPIVDPESGRPCYETCPLAQGSGQHGWAHSRVFESRAGRRRTSLDCFFLNCLLPTAQKTTLCFVERPGRVQTNLHTKVLEAIEAIYPAVSGTPDVKATLAVSLEALLRTTGADACEAFLVEPNTGALVLAERVNLPSLADAVRHGLMGERFSDLLADSLLPLVAIDPGEGGARGWYVSAPLVGDGRVLGVLGLASQRPDFNVAAGVRVLFPVAAQLGVYLQSEHRADVGRKQTSQEGDPAVALRFRVLGAFQAFISDQPVPITRFQRFKALTLLKFLVGQRGRPATREALMEVLWPEADPTRAAANLRVVLHAVRRALEPVAAGSAASSFVLSQGDLVFLDPSKRIWVDAEEFVGRSREGALLAAQGRPEAAIAALRAAASLYGGDYMADDPYSDWCLFERERLRELYLTVLKQLARLLAEQDDAPSAVDVYRTALGVEASREEIHRELMRVLWQTGLRDEALRQYESCRRVLRSELAAEPSEATTALYEAILRGLPLQSHAAGAAV